MKLVITQVRLEGVSDFGNHPFNLPFIPALREGVSFSAPITFFSGPNGCGKTTLLEALAVFIGLDRYGGSINMVEKSSWPTLAKHLVVGRSGTVTDAFFFRSETFFELQNALQDINPAFIYQYTGSEKNFRELSHGEGFGAFFENRIRPGGIYFLDEPESALAFQKQLELLFVLHEFTKVGCQFFIATHSPILLCHPSATIYAVDKELVKIPYEQTLAFRQISDFLASYKRVQKELR